MRPIRVAILFVLLLLAPPLRAQNTAPTPPASFPFLLHLETMTFDDQSCVLLRSDGQFHLEAEKGDRTRVFEGNLSNPKLLEVQKLINDAPLRQLTQKQIVAPAENVMLDELHVNIFRGDHWQSLFFVDASSRKPFENFIAPLVRWLQELPREPHTELSEDAGKNDCQLPKRIVLKLRKPAPGKDPSHP